MYLFKAKQVARRPSTSARSTSTASRASRCRRSSTRARASRARSTRRRTRYAGNGADLVAEVAPYITKTRARALARARHELREGQQGGRRRRRRTSSSNLFQTAVKEAPGGRRAREGRPHDLPRAPRGEEAREQRLRAHDGRRRRRVESAPSADETGTGSAKFGHDPRARLPRSSVLPTFSVCCVTRAVRRGGSRSSSSSSGSSRSSSGSASGCGTLFSFNGRHPVAVAAARPGHAGAPDVPGEGRQALHARRARRLRARGAPRVERAAHRRGAAAARRVDRGRVGGRGREGRRMDRPERASDRALRARGRVRTSGGRRASGPRSSSPSVSSGPYTPRRTATSRTPSISAPTASARRASKRRASSSTTTRCPPPITVAFAAAGAGAVALVCGVDPALFRALPSTSRWCSAPPNRIRRDHVSFAHRASRCALPSCPAIIAFAPAALAQGTAARPCRPATNGRDPKKDDAEERAAPADDARRRPPRPRRPQPATPTRPAPTPSAAEGHGRRKTSARSTSPSTSASRARTSARSPTTPASTRPAANGILAGIGIGYRFKELRIGARFRDSSTTEFSLWSLMGEIGYGLPFRPVSPVLFVHAGYMFDTGVERAVDRQSRFRGATSSRRNVELDGLVVGGELRRRAVWLTKFLRIGPFIGVDFTWLHRSQVEPAAVDRPAHRRDEEQPALQRLRQRRRLHPQHRPPRHGRHRVLSRRRYTSRMYRKPGSPGVLKGVLSGPYAGGRKLVDAAKLPRAARQRLADVLTWSRRADADPPRASRRARVALPRARGACSSAIVALATLTAIGLRESARGVGVSAACARRGLRGAAHAAPASRCSRSIDVARSRRVARSFPGATSCRSMSSRCRRRTLRGEQLVVVTPLGDARDARIRSARNRDELVLVLDGGAEIAFPLRSEREGEHALRRLEHAQTLLEELTYARELEKSLANDAFFDVRVDDSWDVARVLRARRAARCGSEGALLHGSLATAAARARGRRSRLGARSWGATGRAIARSTCVRFARAPRSRSRLSRARHVVSRARRRRLRDRLDEQRAELAAAAKQSRERSRSWLRRVAAIGMGADARGGGCAARLRRGVYRRACGARRRRRIRRSRRSSRRSSRAHGGRAIRSSRCASRPSVGPRPSDAPDSDHASRAARTVWAFERIFSETCPASLVKFVASRPAREHRRSGALTGARSEDRRDVADRSHVEETPAGGARAEDRVRRHVAR